MTLETAFTAANLFALLGWIALAFAPLARARLLVAARVVAFLLCVAYAAGLAMALSNPVPGGGFGSLAGIAALFSVKSVLLAAWIHYLAFDLWAGAWEVKDAERAGVPHWLVLPCLVATFMAGPIGLGAYLIIRTGFRGRAMVAVAP